MPMQVTRRREAAGDDAESLNTPTNRRAG